LLRVSLQIDKPSHSANAMIHSPRRYYDPIKLRSLAVVGPLATPPLKIVASFLTPILAIVTPLLTILTPVLTPLLALVTALLTALHPGRLRLSI
jgi:hypothetical protein